MNLKFWIAVRDKKINGVQTNELWLAWKLFSLQIIHFQMKYKSNRKYIYK